MHQSQRHCYVREDMVEGFSRTAFHQERCVVSVGGDRRGDTIAAVPRSSGKYLSWH